MKKPATALPWCTMPAQHGGKQIRGFDCTDVARLGLDINHADKQIEQNAAYIAHACNAYPQLIEALRAVSADDCPGARHALKLLAKLGETQS